MKTRTLPLLLVLAAALAGCTIASSGDSEPDGRQQSRNLRDFARRGLRPGPVALDAERRAAFCWGDTDFAEAVREAEEKCRRDDDEDEDEAQSAANRPLAVRIGELYMERICVAQELGWTKEDEDNEDEETANRMDEEEEEEMDMNAEIDREVMQQDLDNTNFSEMLAGAVEECHEEADGMSAEELTDAILDNQVKCDESTGEMMEEEQEQPPRRRRPIFGFLARIFGGLRRRRQRRNTPGREEITGEELVKEAKGVYFFRCVNMKFERGCAAELNRAVEQVIQMSDNQDVTGQLQEQQQQQQQQQGE